MSALSLLAALAVGIGFAAAAALWVPPTRKLAPRVRPYSVVARAAFGHVPDIVEPAPPPVVGGALGRLFGPPVRAALARIGRPGDARGDERLARMLTQAGYESADPAEHRVRQVLQGVVGGVLAGGCAALLDARTAPDIGRGRRRLHVRIHAAPQATRA